MDGTNTTYIATKDISSPNGLAIDFTSKTQKDNVDESHVLVCLISLKLSVQSFQKCLLCNHM